MEENFLVSARKYRPQRFDEVVGQEKITDTLKNAIKSNHLAHSFLFNGTRGVGKTTLARILAKTINCTNKSSDTEACNECESCKSFNTNASFNVYELDAASKNSVDDIRNLIEQVNYPPQNATYKVFIIDEVHMLSIAAFNSFLKTLEEPPSYAKFILATTEKHKIPATILSRCQVYDFKKINVTDIQNHLAKIAQKEGVDADTNALNIISLKAEGGLRDALSIFDRLVSINDKQLTYDTVLANLNVLDYDYYFKLIEAIRKQDNAQCLLILDEILANGFEIETTMTGLSEHIRNLWVAKKDTTLSLLESTEEIKKRYIEQAGEFDEASLLNYLTLVTDTEKQLKLASNKRLTAEVMLLKMCYVSQLVDTSWTEVGEKKKPNVKPAITTTEKVVEEDKTDYVPKASGSDITDLAALTAKAKETLAKNENLYVDVTPSTIENKFIWDEIMHKFEGSKVQTDLLNAHPPEIQNDTFLFTLNTNIEAGILTKLFSTFEKIYFELTNKKAYWKCEIEYKENDENEISSNELFDKLSEEFPILKKLNEEFKLDL